MLVTIPLISCAVFTYQANDKERSTSSMLSLGHVHISCGVHRYKCIPFESIE